MKSALKSKTIWLAILQGIAGALVVIITQDPIINVVGVAMIVKGGIDAMLRFLTTEQIAL